MPLVSFVAGQFAKFAEVNRRYAKPRIKMTPMVRVTLVLLVLYLVLLVGILVFKFITIVTT